MTNDPTPFVPGQRWTSDLEPELGLGIVHAVDGRTVIVRFAASDATRRYAAASAPLTRARFHVGDEVTDRHGARVSITAVELHAGLLSYHTGKGALPESDLADSTSFSTPEARLANGRVDPSARFDLRRQVLELRQRVQGSAARGFVGGRVDLIPHQLYVAREVTRRFAPRVLLADEVGLGKTIEACLIMHHLLVTGRAERVLIIVPESLLHQWLVELFRRFNLRFRLFDAERCEAIEEARGDNPFLDEQLILCSTQFLAAARGKRGLQAAVCDWDLLVVDEAHHLVWTPTAASAEYRLVEAIAGRAAGLLLLTATPEQLGVSGHFARLRLLDPERYPDLEQFVAETAGYREVARVADILRTDEPVAAADWPTVTALLADGASGGRGPIEAAMRGDRAAREQALVTLIDRHGTGRVMFRNTRAAIGGFPARHAHLIPLPAPLGPDLDEDPRIDWLAAHLVALDSDKVLLICASVAMTAEIDEALGKRLRVKTALFHERLSLIQRDRNAAHFAEPSGARLLICSEIGSEGRNFQFVRHLVLFDLPFDPDLLEQRIGRLDRIGQQRAIEVWIPFIEGSDHEVLARWHHDGLDGIERSLRGGQSLHQQFGARVQAMCAELVANADRGATLDAAALGQLVAESRVARDSIEAALRVSRDHLLELSSCRPAEARGLIAEISVAETDPKLTELAVRMFEHLGVYVSEIGDRTFRFNPDALTTADFPELERGDVAMTFDRQRALTREDITYLSWDHPLLVRAIELLLGGEVGGAALVARRGAPDPLAVESLYVLECVAPLALHVDRFLPPTPIRTVVNHLLADRTALYAEAAALLEDRPGGWLVENANVARTLVPAMLARSRVLAEAHAVLLRSAALAAVRNLAGAEVERLRSLRLVNPSIRLDEIDRAELARVQLTQHVESARLRLDAVRVIVAG